MPTPPLTPPDKENKAPRQPPPPSQPRVPAAAPLQPRVPNIAAPEIRHSEPDIEPDAETDATPNASASTSLTSASTVPKPASGPRRKCPNCLYFPMKPLVDFKDEDIEKAYVGETFVPNSAFSFLAPFLSLFIIMGSFLSNLLFAKAKDAKSRNKVRVARSEILARCPNSLICPECCEVLEIY